MQKLRQTDLSQPAGPQRVSRQLRELFREAFDHLGGVEWLVEFAQKNDQNARVFVQAVSKLLPASAPEKDKQRVVVDIPWLTQDRLAYKGLERGRPEAGVEDLLPLDLVSTETIEVEMADGAR
jgi:hypothetical protein